MITARQVFFAGHVQGVGFRYTTAQFAQRFDVTGWVRNLEDGRVEMFVQAEAAELETFLAEIRKSELAGHFSDLELVPASPDETLRGFAIRH